MTPELSKKLFDKYPKIFSDTNFFGFECGDGWYNLIDVLCQELGKDPSFKAVQVKEKFGGLRFYAIGASSKAFDFIDFAEKLSYRICEQCGCPGKVRSGGWIRTLCEKCYE